MQKTKKFIVRVQEILRRDVEVEAKDAWEAKEKAREMYDDREIILTSDDYVGEADFIVKGVAAKETKEFTFGVTYQTYGDVTVDVPADLDLEGAKKYVEEHWAEMPLPHGAYVPDSDEPDFSNANFEED